MTIHDSRHDESAAGDHRVTRRAMLSGAGAGAAAIVAALVSGIPESVVAQQSSTPHPVVPDDPTKAPGTPTTPLGSRSPFVAPARSPVGNITGSSLTPLQDLTGTITPSDLHFERHHAGIPVIDPSTHTLFVHGLVERPTMFSLDDLKRFPQVTRTAFVECSGNGELAWRSGPFGTPNPGLSPQKVAGLTANSEWTGVSLRALFDEVGAKRDATWFLAEGGDASRLARSIPIEKARDDALVVWAQNGEPIRPAQGFPLRLLLPGWEGSTNVKWLRRLELGTRPWMTRWETATYTDPLADGTARQFAFVMDATSIITSPAHPETIAPGWRQVSGLSWTGRGVIKRVEVSTDAGRSWEDARLQEPVLPKAHTRFTHMWNWDGREAILLSRATDETGYVQPTRAELMRARGPGTLYHWNFISGWRVMPNGRVFFHGAT